MSCSPRRGALFYVACTRARERLWSPPWPRPTTTASSRRGSSRSWCPTATTSAPSPGARRARCRCRDWWPSCVVPSPIRTAPEPLRAAAAAPAGAVGGRVDGPQAAGPDGGPRDLVGDPCRQPFGRADPRGRPAGADLGERARRDRCLPDPLVPREGGRRRRALDQSGQPRPARRTPSPSGSPTRAIAADVDVLMSEVDRVWDRLDFRTPWSKQREHKRVRAALEPVPRLARPQPAPAAGDRGEVRHRRDDGRRRPGPDQRVRRPGRARR